MAGYTEIVLPQGVPSRAQQYDTAVVPAHRGHGLGLRIKAAMVRRLRAEHPGVTEIETDNAEDNAPIGAPGSSSSICPSHDPCRLTRSEEPCRALHDHAG